MTDYPAIHGSLDTYSCTAYLPYYPKRFNVSEDLQAIRQTVWRFKDGATSKHIAELLADAITEDLPDCRPRDTWWLCIIPASTASKTQTRFKEFCSEFCRLTGFNNGYHLIVNTDDREAKHLEENRNAVHILEHMAFGDVRGKNILVFDDVCTTGSSFLNVAYKLDQLGATRIRGLFLGKTHWLNDNGSVSLGARFIVADDDVEVVFDNDDDYELDALDGHYQTGVTVNNEEPSTYKNSKTRFSDPDDEYYPGDYDEEPSIYDVYSADDSLRDLLDGQMDAYWNID